ncbi:hypothetical protein HDU96_010496 [Phlyctochytrium bullatum]|nr:hypothetical protein HDU96_010496 [Phlyctochytrium bullatum]
MEQDHLYHGWSALPTELLIPILLYLHRNDLPKLASADRYLRHTSPACFESNLDLAIQHLEKVVETLLDKGAVLDKGDTRSARPAHEAVDRDVEILRLLLDRGADLETTDFDGFTLLSRAVDRGKYKAFKLLLKRRGNPNARDRNGHTPLHVAALKGRFEHISSLVEAGCDINALKTRGQPGTAFDIVCSTVDPQRRIRFVRNLLKFGGDPNVTGFGKGRQSALCAACTKGDVEIVKLLLQHAFVDELAARMVEAGADVNARDSKGATVLHVAANRCFWKMVLWLVKRKEVDLEALDGEDREWLDIVVAKNSSRLDWFLEQLRACGLDIEDGKAKRRV